MSDIKGAEVTNHIEVLRKPDGTAHVTMISPPDYVVQRLAIPAENVKLMDEIVKRYVEALKRLAEK
jgi:hypothetical protein